LHGHGWQGIWRVKSRDDASATLVFDEVPSDWPWLYVAEQNISLSPGNLRIELSLTSRSDEAMPYGLGFHPWFPKLPGTRLMAMVDGVWLAAEDCIPTARAPAARFADFPRGVLLSDAPHIDHCFTGFHGSVTISQPGRHHTLSLSASPECGYLHLYVPSDRAVFCAEPVTTMPDALNRPEPPEQTGLRVLEPGTTVSVWMNLAMKAEA
jgi:aldose 1-epimerase